MNSAEKCNVQLVTVMPALFILFTAQVLCLSGLQGHGVVNPLSVVGDDSVNSRLFYLATLLSSIGSDAHCNAIVEQGTSRVTLKNKTEKLLNRILQYINLHLIKYSGDSSWQQALNESER